MKTSHLVVALAFSAAACSNNQSDPLVGSWGGAGLAASASAAGVMITAGCGATVQINHAIFLDGMGQFAVQDSLRGSIGGGAPKDTLPHQGRPPGMPVLITGSVTGDVLTISLQFLSGPAPSTFNFEGQRNQPMGDQVCRV